MNLLSRSSFFLLAPADAEDDAEDDDPDVASPERIDISDLLARYNPVGDELPPKPTRPPNANRPAKKAATQQAREAAKSQYDREKLRYNAFMAERARRLEQQRAPRQRAPRPGDRHATPRPGDHHRARGGASLRGANAQRLLGLEAAEFTTALAEASIGVMGGCTACTVRGCRCVQRTVR